VAVKGPGLRITLDVRRIWRCPRCGRIARTPGSVTAQRCGCSDDAWMQLQPPVKRERYCPPPRTPEQIAEDRADDTEDELLPEAVPEAPPAASTTTEPAAVPVNQPPADDKPEGPGNDVVADLEPPAEGFGAGIPPGPTND
jgi:hypothetical protein